ncbi:MAG: outer membrane protein assembly factor BamD [Deltaproteobacteria bacterium]|nr:outer membrane protein assembly factor BamD [Deltaproteobacteria bacterium]
MNSIFRTPLSFLRVALGGWLALAAFSGCSAFETNLQDTEVSYQDTARKNYESGDEAFSRESYNEAIKFFEYVKNKFPYSKYAVLADLRVADAHFAREKWLEAADSYRLFSRFHPRHEKVPYALFRAAFSYSKEMQEDFVLLPPLREKDQSATYEAIGAFDEFLARFPNNENVEEAKKLRVLARTRLAEHDLYAAGFYAQRNHWQGAAYRYEHISREFSDTPLASTSLLELGRILDEQLHRPKEAQLAYLALIEQHPEAKEVGAAKVSLKVLLDQERQKKPIPTPAPASGNKKSEKKALKNDVKTP